MMGIRLQKRRGIVSAIDHLISWPIEGEWIGNLHQLFDEIRRQGYAAPSDYLMRKVLLECGAEKGYQGQYRITREQFTKETS